MASHPSLPDRLLATGTRVATLISASLVGLVAAFLLGEALPAIGRLGPSRLLGDVSYHPSLGRYDLLPLLLGSLLVTAGAVIVAAPVGILAGAFAVSYAPPWLRGGFHHLLALAGGMPSVVLGFWGLVRVVPWLAAIRAPGTSLLAAILVVAILILPTIALFTARSLQAVPAAHRLAGAALGLSPSAVTLRIVFPLAAPGILVGILLAATRALGETMAVAMVAGNVVHIPSSLLDPVRTLTTNIALEMGYATGLHRSVLFASGLLHLALVVLLLLAAHRVRHREGRRD